MKTTRIGMFALMAVLGGCVTSSLPSGARLVGGGIKIEYKAPTDGTAIVLERASDRMVVTKSLAEGDDFSFEFDPTGAGQNETNLFSTNAFFQLYFVPMKAKKE